MSEAFLLIHLSEFSWLALALSVSLWGEFCLGTTPKLASIVWTYVCRETSWFVRLQVVSAPCWLGTAPSVLAESEEQINFSQHSAKILFKMTSESFESCLVIVLGPFLKISRWVPLNLA